MMVGRNYKRCNCGGEGLFKCINGEPVSIRPLKLSIINISACGASITTNNKLELDQIINMDLSFNINAHHYNLNVHGKVSRILSDLTTQEFGIEFLNFPEHIKIQLDEAIKHTKTDAFYIEEQEQINDIAFTQIQ